MKAEQLYKQGNYFECLEELYNQKEKVKYAIWGIIALSFIFDVFSFYFIYETLAVAGAVAVVVAVVVAGAVVVVGAGAVAGAVAVVVAGAVAFAGAGAGAVAVAVVVVGATLGEIFLEKLCKWGLRI